MRRNVGALRVVVVSLMLLPLIVVPAAAGRASYSCSMSVYYVESPLASFVVVTTISATDGQLPRSEIDFLQSFKNGVLYDSSRQDFTVLHRSTSATVAVVVQADGAGVYTFYSTVGVVKGSGALVRLAECGMSAAL